MILDDIVSAKTRELVKSKQDRPFADLKSKARSAPPIPPLELRHPQEVSIIAEIKRASPAKGPLAPHLDPQKIARAYLEGGARALSVLTESTFFKGSVEDLRQARLATGLPILRKDFIIDAYQLWETRVMCASAALLIVHILEQGQLAEYVDMAHELGLSALVEVHSEPEVERALDAKARLVGINNRDLETFSVALETTARLRSMLPDSVVTVSESGISSAEDLRLLKSLKIDGALIGEELIRAPDPVAKLKELRHAG